MPPSITIFTPTYNRVHTLPRLYKSLLAQTEQNFQWLIVDDGSSDGTEDLIKEYQKEAKINISYIKQVNQGKHIAINTGLQYATGDYFLIIDSDDYILKHCIETCHQLSALVEDQHIAGFTFIHFTEDIKYDPAQYNNKTWFYDEDGELVWKEWGEMAFCYKTDIAKQFPFPQFEGEKFCPESLVHHRIGNKYRVLYTNYVLASGVYQEDGLSSKYALLMENNPRASLLTLKEKIVDSNSPVQKEAWAKQYWNIALKAKHIPWVEKFQGIPFGLSFSFWKRRLLRLVFRK